MLDPQTRFPIQEPDCGELTGGANLDIEGEVKRKERRDLGLLGSWILSEIFSIITWFRV